MHACIILICIFMQFVFIIKVTALIGQNKRMDSQQFGQRRPPLSVTIKGILERYPDGQIFKVK